MRRKERSALFQNPVFWYHLLGQSRYRWHKQKALTLISITLVGLIYLYLLAQTIQYEVEPVFVQILGLLMMCLLIPLGCYSLFSMEYEKATWESLAITRLTANEIVFGKWFSRVLGVLLITLLIAPLSFNAWSQSVAPHISFLGWLGAMWMLLSWGVLLVSMGMWLSLRLRHSIATASLLYGIQVFALLFLPMLVMVLMALTTMGRFDITPFAVAENEEPLSIGEKLKFWLMLPFDWRCLYVLNPFIATNTLLSRYSGEHWLTQYGFGWGQGCYYWLFAGLFYLLTRWGVQRAWRK
ncbi:hypothetical protein HRbin15_00146 [bacterium HR15]|nr:hypothetical protein HRbin15_00146 [bacterium HR15]